MCGSVIKRRSGGTKVTWDWLSLDIDWVRLF
jgi:hypothetical protein